MGQVLANACVLAALAANDPKEAGAHRPGAVAQRPDKAAKEGAAVKKTTTETKAEDTGKLEQQIEDVIGNL